MHQGRKGAFGGAKASQHFSMCSCCQVSQQIIAVLCVVPTFSARHHACACCPLFLAHWLPTASLGPHSRSPRHASAFQHVTTCRACGSGPLRRPVFSPLDTWGGGGGGRRSPRKPPPPATPALSARLAGTPSGTPLGPPFPRPATHARHRNPGAPRGRKAGSQLPTDPQGAGGCRPVPDPGPKLHPRPPPHEPGNGGSVDMEARLPRVRVERAQRSQERGQGSP